jgi:transcription elongation factor Elf1
MGMFDSIYFTCPNCGSNNVEEQSKAGDCLLHNYQQDEVPHHVAYDIQGNTVKCYDCGSLFVIESAEGEIPPPPITPPTYKLKLAPKTDE